MDSKISTAYLKNRKAGSADNSKIGEDIIEKEKERFLRVICICIILIYQLNFIYEFSLRNNQLRSHRWHARRLRPRQKMGRQSRKELQLIQRGER